MEGEEIPDEGAVFALGASGLGQGETSKFWIRGDPVVGAAAGAAHSAVLTRSGRLFTFGSGDEGQLGRASQPDKPASVKALKGRPVCLVACGARHTLVSLVEGGCLAFGRNEEGQLGVGDVERRELPCPVPALYQLPVARLSAGRRHSLALLQDGRVFAWGSNDHHQLGLPDIGPQDVASPQPVPLHDTVVALSAGADHSVLLSEQGTVRAFGSNAEGQLGLGDSSPDCVSAPSKVALSETVTAVAAGATHTLFLSSAGRLYSAGSGEDGELGLGEERRRSRSPAALSPVPPASFTSVFAGRRHSAAVSEERQLFVCGSNEGGKLGFPLAVGRVWEARLAEECAHVAADGLACGDGHCLLLGRLRSRLPKAALVPPLDVANLANGHHAPPPAEELGADEKASRTLQGKTKLDARAREDETSTEEPLAASTGEKVHLGLDGPPLAEAAAETGAEPGAEENNDPPEAEAEVPDKPSALKGAKTRLKHLFSRHNHKEDKPEAKGEDAVVEKEADGKSEEPTPKEDVRANESAAGEDEGKAVDGKQRSQSLAQPADPPGQPAKRRNTVQSLRDNVRKSAVCVLL